MITKYWFKIVEIDNIILKTVYNQVLCDSNNGHKNWISNVNKQLNEYRFSYAFDNVNTIDKNIFI
jgi:hypothetical protein